MSTETPSQESVADDWAQALEEQSSTSTSADDGPHVFEANATPIPTATGASTGNPMHDIQMVLDIPVQLSVELGRTRVPIKYILQLAQGSIVELDALAGEPMDVLVNGYLIAQGEVVVVNDKFGIRLTDIVTPSERMKRVSRT
ncbi:MAG: flagellar motor switch protein FliN [Hydrogenophaga sp.]|uniref:flagellar motor switch protein FliN n=1 Tax=Hydrogenophaga sp. TaxID=1904254 RepID=UPI00261F16E6|nr:flagellar motor switch protein FliN [Hydrogenophaga sp.]MDM7944193.1 flagellar motor switch protein FliN [Hydrogenophaga sp.]